jgi:type II secretory pathway component GspD/PulD (secretin)
MRTFSILACILLAAGLAAAQTPSTSKGTMSLNLSLTDDNGIDAVTEIITLKNIKASEIEPFIRARLSRYGAVQVNDALNMLIVTDKQPKVRDLAGIVQKMDAAGIKDFLRLETEALKLRCIAPSRIRPYIQARLSTEGSIIANDELNQLIITDLRSRIENIKAIIPQLDMLPRQAVIEFKIFDVTEVKQSGLGINMLRNSTASVSANYRKDPGDVLRGSVTGNASFRFDAIEYLNQQRLDLLNDYIVARPFITVQNRSWGELSTSLGYYQSSDASNLTIRVLPNITESNMIGLNVNLDFLGAEGSDNHVESNLTAPADKPIVIGKITYTYQQKTKRGIPLLRDIPLLGYLFGIRTMEHRQRQLLVVATAHSFEPGQGIADTTQLKDNK